MRQIANRLGLRPTKQRGQNFVIDANTVRRIVAAARLDAADVVLEVGPGLGSLTLGLLETGAQVVAVEIDEVLASALWGTIAERAPDQVENFRLITSDALGLTQFDLPTATALVANLPYNVSVPVLLHLMALVPSLAKGLVMVQAETADRLVAPPGSRTYGVPSVKAAWFADVVRAGSVGPSVFWPAPRVDSGLVAWTRRDPPVTTATRSEVFALIDAAFAQRRKTLRAALRGVIDADGFARAEIDPMLRGEVLDVGDFARLAQSATGLRARR